MNDRGLRMVVALLVVGFAALAVVEWWRAGELESLGDRLRRLEQLVGTPKRPDPVSADVDDDERPRKPLEPLRDSDSRLRRVDGA